MFCSQVCARNCWIPLTAQNTKANFSAKYVTHVNSDQKATVSVEVLAAYPWTPETT